MNTKEILNNIKDEYNDSFKGSVAIDLIENGGDEPLQFMLDTYGDLSLKFILDPSLYTDWLDEMEEIIKNHIESAQSHIQIASYMTDAVWFTYQVYIQEILIELGALESKNILFK